jgi:hypothetical protein
MLNSNNPSYLWTDEMHRIGENPHVVKYFGPLLKYHVAIASPIHIMELVGGGFQRIDN